VISVDKRKKGDYLDNLGIGVRVILRQILKE